MNAPLEIWRKEKPMTEIDDKYAQLNGASGFLGQPVDIERQTPNGLGRYRHYEHGSIYWHHAFPFSAFVIYGLIRQKWAQMGWENSPLGFPITDEDPAGTAGGRISRFENGAILYRPDIGTFETHGAIFRRWANIGGFNTLGFPLTDELITPDTRGRYNHFERGSIYWTPETGAWDVSTDIRDEWAAKGWELGPVGYPVNASMRLPGVATDFQDFERGTIYAFGPNHLTVERKNTSVFATSESFINWTSFGLLLPDGDIISASFSQNFPQFGINITLTAGPGIIWWKALSLFTVGQNDFQEIFTENGRSTATFNIDPSILAPGDIYLHFKKAKSFGAHTGVYYLGRADRLIGTNVTFTWLRD
ncbi:MAG: hypothetical protein EHM21_12210 [Chloroflexi bacterium]|nr:MAG: hypothetical protein EHM21_12210 [Chloroflexota bacterium]